MTKDGRIVAGALMLHANRHIWYLHGAALEDYVPLRPVNLLFSEIMWDAREKGNRWFGFGPSWGLEGVRRFKESFGAKLLELTVVYVEEANS